MPASLLAVTCPKIRQTGDPTAPGSSVGLRIAAIKHLRSRKLRRGPGWAFNERALAHFLFAFISGSMAGWIGLGAADSTSFDLGRFSVFANAKPINPDRTRKAPASINQCGYSIAESIGSPFTSDAGAIMQSSSTFQTINASGSASFRSTA